MVLIIRANLLYIYTHQKRGLAIMRVQETMRDDGLRIISSRIRSQKVYLGIMCPVGSAYDPLDMRGLYHYFEHMAFKGTEQRTVQDLRNFAARFLLENNAATGNLGTIYSGMAVQRKFPELCEFLCDTYFHSVYPEEEIEREKEVVLNEIEMRKDNDYSRAYLALGETLWQKNPLRESGGGTVEGVMKITRSDLLGAHALYRIPACTVIIAVGAIDHDNVVKTLNTLIPRDITPCPPRKIWDTEYDMPPTEQYVTITLPQKQKATIVCGCKFPVHRDKRVRVLRSFLVHMLVLGTNSILWNEIREKRGFAYSVSGGIGGEYSLGNYFFADASVLPSRVETVCDLIHECIHKPLSDLRQFEITQEWLYDWHTLEYETLEDWAGLIMGRLNMELPVKQSERYFGQIRNLIRSVTLDEVEELRVSTLKREKFATVIVRPE